MIRELLLREDLIPDAFWQPINEESPLGIRVKLIFQYKHLYDTIVLPIIMLKAILIS